VKAVYKTLTLSKVYLIITSMKWKWTDSWTSTQWIIKSWELRQKRGTTCRPSPAWIWFVDWTANPSDWGKRSCSTPL